MKRYAVPALAILAVMVRVLAKTSGFRLVVQKMSTISVKI